MLYVQGGAKNGATGHPISLQIFRKLHDRIAWKLVDFMQYYMMNTVVNFLFKNFIALWRHLAKTPLLSFIHTEHHTVAVFSLGGAHSEMKFLNRKVNDCVQHIILQKFTNFHVILSWSFQNICNKIGWPRFFAPPCRWCR